MLNFVGRGNYTHFSINSKFLGKRRGREKMISHFFTAPYVCVIENCEKQLEYTPWGYIMTVEKRNGDEK